MAGQFLDVFIKFDTRTMSGYALRIIRTVKSARAVDFMLVRYDGGVVTPLSEPVTTTVFLTTCTITLETSGGVMTAKAVTNAAAQGDYPNTVELSAKIDGNTFGGAGLLFTSSGGSNSTVFNGMEIIFKP